MKYFLFFDEIKIVYYDLGEGLFVLMLYGFFGNVYMNYIVFGIVEIVVNMGYRVILFDFWGYGEFVCLLGE